MHLLALAPLLGLALAAVHGVPQQPIRLSPAVDGVPTPVRPAATCTFTPTILQTLSEDYPATKFPNAVNDPNSFNFISRNYTRGAPANRIIQFLGFTGIKASWGCELWSVFPSSQVTVVSQPSGQGIGVFRVLTNQPQDIVAGKWTWYDRAYLKSSGSGEIQRFAPGPGAPQNAGQPGCSSSNTAFAFLLEIPEERNENAFVKFKQRKATNGFYMIGAC